MATSVTQPETSAVLKEQPQGRGESASRQIGTGRLLSLDAYRGFIMLLLVSEGFGFGVLKDHPHWAWLAAQADHSAWEGCTF